MEQVAAVLAYLGVSPPDVFAGFCGSVVGVAGGGTKPGKLLLTMMANTILANYFGVEVGGYLGTTGAHLGSFCVGWLGLAVARKVVEARIPGFFSNAEQPDGKP